MNPIIIINFKTYEQATGSNAVALAKICEEVAKEKNADIRVAVQAADIYHVSQKVSIPVYAEHIDPIDPGRNTGFLLPEDAKDNGAIGTLLNHSEHRLPDDVLTASVEQARGAGLKVLICAATAKEGAAHATLKPEFIAVEPPELIGGKISVSSAKPELISEAVKMIDAPVLVGAGVHTGEDVKIAMELGAKGVLLASGVTKAEDPKAVLLGLLDSY